MHTMQGKTGTRAPPHCNGKSAVFRIGLLAVAMSLWKFAPIGYADEPPSGTEATAQTSPVEAAATSSNMRASDPETLLYALGVLLSRDLEGYQLSPTELNLVQAGLADGVNHHAKEVDLTAAGTQLQAMRRERVAMLVKHQQEAGVAFIDKVAAVSGAKRTASGLVIITLHAGAGARPGHADQVEVNYEGRLIDGTVFDSSIKRGKPALVNLSNVIPCWSEALQLMKVGGKSRILCPPELAYGDRGAPPLIRPQSALDFQVELLGIVSAQERHGDPDTASATRHVMVPGGSR